MWSDDYQVPHIGLVTYEHVTRSGVLNMSGTQENVHLDLAAERVAASKQRLAQFIRSTHGSEC